MSKILMLSTYFSFYKGHFIFTIIIYPEKIILYENLGVMLGLLFFNFILFWDWILSLLIINPVSRFVF